jgi:hypothetical protein
MKRIKSTIEEFRATQTELAELLKLTPGRISQLTGTVFERGGDGLYDVSQAVIAYERFLWHGAEPARF